MSKVQPRTPSGFVEYLPADQMEFDRLIGIIRTTYEKYGFSPLDTPVVELSEVLLAKGGGETEQQVYRFERGRNDLSLRFDLTVPLARYTAQHENDLVFPSRRYQIGKVFRAERAQAGRFREFYQCDVDIIGSESPLVDAEFPAIINEIFEQFNFGEFTIHLNNRKVLNGFFEALGLNEDSANILRIIDKMAKLGQDELVNELKSAGLTEQQINDIFSFVGIAGDNDEVIAKIKNFSPSTELMQQGAAELESLVKSLRNMKVPESRFVVDLKIARGLDYYTGVVYETFLNDYPEVGSVCSGGRYDDLADNYTNTKLPGVGISIGLTRLFYKLREAGIIQPTKQSPADVIVIPMSEAQFDYGLEVVGQLRSAGVPTVLYTEPNVLKKKIRYADKMDFGQAIIIGEQEVDNESVAVKNMTTGDSESVKLADIVTFLGK